MQALRVHEYGEPPKMSYEDAPDPSPGPGEVLVEIEAAGVNPVDVYVATNGYTLKPQPPFTPGMDAAGTVKQVGEDVSQWSEGDRVIVTTTKAGRLQGAFAEFCICDADWLWPLPEHLSFAQGAAINVPYVTAFRAFFDLAKVKDGQRVFIHGGTGAVGLAALQIAKAHRLHVTATGGSEKGRELLQQQGADRVLDHTADDYLAPLRDEPPHVILEMLANVNLPRDMEIIADHGTIVVIGNRGEVTVNPRLLMAKQSSVTGFTYWSDGDKAIRRAHDALQQGMRAGDINPIIQAEIPMRDAQRAFDLVMNGKSAGKVVLVP